MKVTILISTYNGEHHIRALLDSILNLRTDKIDCKVLIRDDSSVDDTVQIIENEYQWVRIIRPIEGNVGFVESNNIAFAHASGDIICCVNQDTILHRDFLYQGVKILRNNSHVAGINSNMIMPWVMSLDNYLKLEHNDMPAYEYQLTPYGFARYVRVDRLVRETNFMTGGGFFIRKSTLIDDGHLFDPKIDMYCEDTELSLRLQRQGHIIMYGAESIIYHNQAPHRTSPLSNFLKLIHITRNRIALFARYDSPLMYTHNYPMYLFGITKKISYLGLDRPKRIMAYCASALVTLLFALSYPYWLVYSWKNQKKCIGS